MAKIYWKSKITGFSGHGTVDFELEQAEKTATELNEETPEIEHWVV